jgi:hypothetical protein
MSLLIVFMRSEGMIPCMLYAQATLLYLRMVWRQFGHTCMDRGTPNHIRGDMHVLSYFNSIQGKPCFS